MFLVKLAFTKGVINPTEPRGFRWGQIGKAKGINAYPKTRFAWNIFCYKNVMISFLPVRDKLPTKSGVSHNCNYG